MDIDTTAPVAREAELIKLISLLDRVLENRDWQQLSEMVFEPRVTSLEKLLELESKKSQLCEPEIYRFQGRLIEAEKYQLEKLRKTYKVELENIRKRTNENH